MPTEAYKLYIHMTHHWKSCNFVRTWFQIHKTQGVSVSCGCPVFGLLNVVVVCQLMRLCVSSWLSAGHLLTRSVNLCVRVCLLPAGHKSQIWLACLRGSLVASEFWSVLRLLTLNNGPWDLYIKLPPSPHVSSVHHNKLNSPAYNTFSY